MGHEDIGGMIADALEALEERPGASGGGKAALPHGDAILEQYVALCRTAEAPEREPSAEVALPVREAGDRGNAARQGPLASAVRKVLARVRR